MKPLHISLNTAHSGSKSGSSISSFTHSLQVFLPLPLLFIVRQIILNLLAENIQCRANLAEAKTHEAEARTHEAEAKARTHEAEARVFGLEAEVKPRGLTSLGWVQAMDVDVQTRFQQV